MINKLLHFIKKDFLLITFVLYVIGGRVPIVIQRLVPFQFDHGKDSIAVLHMFLTATPKLIGPWTSIPGLFFGPAWYYLLLPGIAFLNGDPITPVITMIVLGICTVCYVYYAFGKIEAAILAASSVFYTITTSAWNPFPMVLISFVILNQLKVAELKKSLSIRSSLMLGAATSLGFHFSTAFAIFFPILILFSLLIKKVKCTLKSFIFLVSAFFTFFIPQIVFELRHDFLEVTSVLNYLKIGDSEPANLDKFMQIASTLFGEVRETMAPSGYWLLQNINMVFQLVFFSLLILGIYFFTQSRNRSKSYLMLDALVWFTVPVIAFTYLHFNVWYLLPLFSFTVVLLGQIVRTLPRKLLITFLCLYFLMSVSKLVFFLVEDGPHLKSTTSFLVNKEAAIDYIYEQAGDKPFASYQFMPDIYDYPYQYIYFNHALHGDRLPTEFSYQPGVTQYIPEKDDLLKVFHDKIDERQPEIIFLIVENNPESAWYDTWWSHQLYGEILDKKVISSDLTVFMMLPETTK